MSIERDCAACSRGEHDRHNRAEGIKPGLIGGTYCGCTGDCAERQHESFLRFVRGHALMSRPCCHTTGPNHHPACQDKP